VQANDGGIQCHSAGPTLEESFIGGIGIAAKTSLNSEEQA